MADVKSLIIKTEVQGGDKVAATLDKISSSADSADKSASQLSKTFKDIEASAQRMADRLSSIGTTMSVAITAPITLAMGFATKAYAEAEKGDARLRASIEMTGGAVESSMKAYEMFAQRIESLTDVDDDAVKSLITLGLQMGITSDNMEQAVAGAIGLSKAFNLDLAQAMKLTALANEGQYEMLGRYIPALRSAKTESEKMAIVQKAMANGFKLAQAEGQTFSGQMAMLQNEIGNLGEEFGKVVAEFLTPAIGFIKNLVENFQTLDDRTKKLIVGFALLVAAIGPALLIAGKLVSAFIAIKNAMVILDGVAIGLKATLAGINASMVVTAATTAGIAAIIIGWVALIILAFADWEKAIEGLPVSMQKAIVEMLDTLIGFTQQFLKKIETFMTAIAIITAPVGGLFGKAAFEALQALVDKSAEKTDAAVKRLRTTSKGAEATLGAYDQKIKTLQGNTDKLTSKKYDTSGIDSIATAYDNAAAAVGNFADMVRFNAFSALNELNGIASVSSYVIADLMSQLATGVLNEAVAGFKDLGKAMADSKITSEEFLAVMGEMAKRILDMLPMLFLQAGLQLIASGQYALGLGFVAAGLASSFVSGFVEGKQEQSQNAKGNAFENGHAERFARGGAFTNMVVNKPTRFNQSLMGEAGPEAIMPLTRMQDGSLGVSGGGGYAPVYVNVNNYSDSQVDVQERTNDDGSRSIEIVVKQLVNGALGNGDFDKAMKSRYNLRSVGT